MTADDVNEGVAEQLRRRFYRLAINLNTVWATPAPLLAANTLSERAFSKLAVYAVGKVSQLNKPEVIRFLEKTPKNTLRIPMLTRLFPDALYVWLKRRAANNIDSLIAAWYAEDKIGLISRQRYAQAGYPITDRLELVDYHGKWWKFALVPGWRNLKGKTIADVATWQYYQCNSYVIRISQALIAAKFFLFGMRVLCGFLQKSYATSANGLIYPHLAGSSKTLPGTYHV